MDVEIILYPFRVFCLAECRGNVLEFREQKLNRQWLWQEIIIIELAWFLIIIILKSFLFLYVV